jgi:hypothetical protein
MSTIGDGALFVYKHRQVVSGAGKVPKVIIFNPIGLLAETTKRSEGPVVVATWPAGSVLVMWIFFWRPRNSYRCDAEGTVVAQDKCSSQLHLFFRAKKSLLLMLCYNAILLQAVFGSAELYYDE